MCWRFFEPLRALHPPGEAPHGSGEKKQLITLCVSQETHASPQHPRANSRSLNCRLLGIWPLQVGDKNGLSTPDDTIQPPAAAYNQKVPVRSIKYSNK